MSGRWSGCTQIGRQWETAAEVYFFLVGTIPNCEACQEPRGDALPVEGDDIMYELFNLVPKIQTA
jgi:hypothetical protein